MTDYTLTRKVRAISGQTKSKTFTITSPEKFRKIKNICIYNREVLVKLYYRNYKYNQLLQCLKKEII